MTAPVPARPTVLDATVLSNFAYLDAVSRLSILPRPIVVPAVRAEIETAVEAHPFLQNAAAAISDSIPVVTVSNGASELRDGFLDRLDGGEAESLAVAELNNGLLATDDATARSVARDRGVRVTGTIGVLIELVAEDILEEKTADAWLKRVIDENDYRAPFRDLSEYLE